MPSAWHRAYPQRLDLEGSCFVQRLEERARHHRAVLLMGLHLGSHDVALGQPNDAAPSQQPPSPTAERLRRLRMVNLPTPKRCVSSASVS